MHGMNSGEGHAGLVHVPEDKSAFALSLRVQRIPALQIFDVVSEHIQIDAAFRCVDDARAGLQYKAVSWEGLNFEVQSSRTYCKCAHGGDVSALASLRLDNEHPIPARRSTLLDRIARIHKGVQTCVAAQAELRQRHIVRDGRREVHHRDIERRVVLPPLLEDLQRAERLESADHDERVEVVVLEFRGDRAEVDVGQLAVRAEFRTATRHPVVDT